MARYYVLIFANGQLMSCDMYARIWNARRYMEKMRAAGFYPLLTERIA